MARAWWQYAVLIVLLVCSALYEVGDLSYIFRTIRHPKEFPSAQLPIQMATRTIGGGPLRGDQILSVNGRPFTGGSQIDDAVAASHPGEKLLLVVSEPSGRAEEKTVEIGNQESKYNSAGGITLAICVDVVIPVVCLGLGFAVAFIRPRDINAWLLLLLLVSFSSLASTTDWRSSWPSLVFLWDVFRSATWAIWMTLFAIRFPSRLTLDRRMPWLKYLLILPTLALEVVFWGVVWIWRHDVNAAMAFRPLFIKVYFIRQIFEILCVTAFFVILSMKARKDAAPDERRRLRILLTGTQAALTPALLVVLYSLVEGVDTFSNVSWLVEVVSLCMMALFPITLVYVIIVERAMDLKFVIRQSIQYGVARFGVRAARIVLIVVFVNLVSNPIKGWSAAAVAQWFGIGFLGLVVFRQHAVSRASTWVDRRFFREAYNSETVLSELAVEAGRYVEIDPLLEKVGQRISDTLHVPDIVILVREGNIYKTRFSTRHGQPMDIAADSRLLTAPGEENSPVQVYFDNPQPWVRSLNAEELQTLSFMRSELLLAMRGRGREGGQIIGIMSLGPKKSEEPYSKTDMRLLQAIAVQMGWALENSRLAASLADEAANREVMNRELEIAREVQERLFPQQFPKIAEIDGAGYCRPARGVGGDYFDFLELPPLKLGIAIGDVSGKGIAAALLMASLQASLRGQTMAGVHDLAALMRNVNKLVYNASQSNRYATFFYGEFDPSTKQFAYVNAGHNPPVILRGDEVIRLEACGPVVGLLPVAGYSMEVCQMQAGDIFVGYTDGISEAMNEQDEEWDEDRFIAAAKSCATDSASQMIDCIFEAADAFTGSAKQHDDMTLVVVKLTA